MNDKAMQRMKVIIKAELTKLESRLKTRLDPSKLRLYLLLHTQ